MLFGRILRGLGIDVNPGRMIDLVGALQRIEIKQRTDFRYAMRGLLVHSKEEILVFDKAFDLFWQEHDNSYRFWHTAQERAADTYKEILESQGSDRVGAAKTAVKESLGETNPGMAVAQSYSAREELREKDFSDLSSDEIREIREMLTSLSLQLGERKTRRHELGNGVGIDMRRTLRTNLVYGGHVLKLRYRKPKYRPRSLVIIADISGSMEPYTRLLLHFVYCMAVGLEQRVESFVFGTRLTRVTRHMEARNVEASLLSVSQMVEDWSGGTRIGEVLKSFNYVWGRRVLRRGAVVILISDGWDRGTPELLRTEIDRLQRSCFRLVWLNPLLGLPGYEPLNIGMQTALPYVDDFLPVHNLASLEDLVGHLARVGVCRPVRKQWSRVQVGRKV